MAIPKLTYLNVKGLAEAIRLTLHVGHVDFEDIRLSFAEVKQLEDAGKRLFYCRDAVFRIGSVV